MAWSIVGVGAVVEVTTTAHALTEPAGVAAGDLLVACIASRIATNSSITMPTGWLRGAEQKINSIVAGTTGQGSACIAYIVRGSSAPALTFTHPTSPNVALGRIIAYRENTVGGGISFDASGIGATSTGTTAISIASSVTTVYADDLLVGMIAGGSASAYSAYKTANAPSTASGATNTSSAPSTTTWTERADSSSATGADTGLAVFDAVKTATGAGGAITATASVSSGHSLAMTAFRALVATANAWNVHDITNNITLSNSDKTATAVNASGIRSTTTHVNETAGKYYAEFRIDSSAWPTLVGILPTSTSTIVNTNGMGVGASGVVVINGSPSSVDLGTPAINDVLCVAWDAGAERVWFRLNGNPWNVSGTADPATGAEGIDSSFGAATPHALWMRSASAGMSCTVRTTLAEYTQAVPSGFKSWMGETPAGGGVTVAAVGVSAGTAVGTAVVDTVAGVSFGAVGVAAGSAAGTAAVAGKANVSVTGQTATSAAGTVSVAGKANVTGTGVSAAGAVGVASVATVQAVSVTPVGQAAAALAGGVSVATSGGISVTPTGIGAAALAGTAAVVARQSIIVPVGGGGATAPSSSILTAYTPGSDRNDFTGQVGVRLGIGTSDVPVTWLGMRKHSASQTGTFSVKLYEWFTDALVTSVTIDMTAVAVGSYGWASVTPTTMLANGYYGLMLEVVASDGKVWANPGPASFAASIVNVYDIYRIGAGAMQTGLANSMFNGLDIGAGAAGGAAMPGLPALTGAVTVAGKANVTPTGVTTAALTGTAGVATTRAATITPAGQIAAALTGGVSVAVGGGISVTPTSVAGTALTGSAAVSAIQNVIAAPAGQAATALAGSATIAGKAIVATTGQAVTAATGTASVATTRTAIVAATGVAAPALIGGVSVAVGGSVSFTPSGVGAAALAGTAAVVARQVINVTPAGVTASAQVRSPSVSGKANVFAVGQSVAASVGSVTVLATALSGLNVWNGSAWVNKPVKVWTGSVWMVKPVKIWNGSAWM